MNRSAANAAAGVPGRAPSPRVAGFEPSVFAVYSRLAREAGAIDLGQGFPADGPPDFVREALRQAADGPQQYAPMPGLPSLRREVALARELISGREIDPEREVLITVGATEALFAAIQTWVKPGDEVVLFEPFYDAYIADVRMAGATPVVVPLRPGTDGRWTFDPSDLEVAVGPRTAAILVTNPHNPTGTVLSGREADLLVAAAERADAVLIADEVYEYHVFGDPLRLADRPGAWARTLTVSSFGKAFSATGWKVGWIVAPAGLLRPITMTHQWIPFAVATPLQTAAASCLRQVREDGGAYWRSLREEFERRAAALVAALAGGPIRAVMPQGGYFVMADASALPYPDDVAACRDLPARAGVGAIPPSAFYRPERAHDAARWLRLAFCRPVPELQEAGRRLAALDPDALAAELAAGAKPDARAHEGESDR